MKDKVYFTVILVSGEKILSFTKKHDGIKMFFDNIVRDGWLIKNGKYHRMIPASQIKEITWEI